MSNLAYYTAVNNTKTTRELVGVVSSIYDQGALREQDKDFTIESIINYMSNPKYYANNITRKFGIRQQTMMLNFYNR